MISVLVVEDSSVVRRLLVHVLENQQGIQVVGQARDGNDAVRLAERLRPDVIAMDINLPTMDGLAATRRIMAVSPRPIVLVTASYDPDDVAKSFEALASGAVAICAKPLGPDSPGFAQQVAEFVALITIMADVKVVTRRTPTSRTAKREPMLEGLRGSGRVDVIAVAASTGGPAALRTILGGLDGPPPVPIVVVQHLSSGFHEGLASWLAQASGLAVEIAQSGQPLRAGEVLLAPPDRHMSFENRGRIRLSDDPPVRGHRPSADHLFRSAAELYGERALGVILTGMGNDGVEGLTALRRAGGRVIAQDEATSAVFGMPREAVARGLADKTLPLDVIPAALARLWNQGRRPGQTDGGWPSARKGAE